MGQDARRRSDAGLKREAVSWLPPTAPHFSASPLFCTARCLARASSHREARPGAPLARSMGGKPFAEYAPFEHVLHVESLSSLVVKSSRCGEVRALCLRDECDQRSRFA